MSLLQPIRGTIRLGATTPAEVEKATRRLCEALLSHNRLQPADVVAARFVGGASLAASPLEAARASGWMGIPLFFTRMPQQEGLLEVEAHVRLRRKRRLRPLEVS